MYIVQYVCPLISEIYYLISLSYVLPYGLQYTVYGKTEFQERWNKKVTFKDFIQFLGCDSPIEGSPTYNITRVYS